MLLQLRKQRQLPVHSAQGLLECVNFKFGGAGHASWYGATHVMPLYTLS
jgi:hypothetical protein